MPKGIPNSRIQTPGAVAAVPAKNDDLSEFESDELPEQPAAATTEGLSPETAKLVDRLVAEKVAAALAPKPSKTGEQHLPSVEAAMAMADDVVAKGIRPRAIMTPEGYYCHPEMTRVASPGARG